eukprot:comp17245_c0_seq1/m.16280 comp17245_c0_seq1/g.16280  ORF comp17245_c0_seq1/g.16280 comp17245_c0_seq1/m.16280 type:complete len:313 (-) comp17245_c0_seq1:52-990(-)
MSQIGGSQKSMPIVAQVYRDGELLSKTVLVKATGRENMKQLLDTAQAQISKSFADKGIFRIVKMFIRRPESPKDDAGSMDISAYLDDEETDLDSLLDKEFKIGPKIFVRVDCESEAQDGQEEAETTQEADEADAMETDVLEEEAPIAPSTPKQQKPPAKFKATPQVASSTSHGKKMPTPRKEAPAPRQQPNQPPGISRNSNVRHTTQETRSRYSSNHGKRHKIPKKGYISKPAIRRLARRGGVKRISSLIYDETRTALKLFLETVLHDAATYVEYAKRKTVGPHDVVLALRRQGRHLYGFDSVDLAKPMMKK